MKNDAKKNKHKPASSLSLPDCGHNNKRFQCSSVTLADVQVFRNAFYHSADKITQDNFLLRCIKTKSVTRHKVKKGSPTERSSTYFMKNYAKASVPVCVGTFCKILDISRFRLNRLTKKAYHNLPVIENRGGFRRGKLYEKKTESIVQFLESLRCVESHYCRGKTERRYLPAELNIEKLYNIYVEQLKNDEKQDVPKRSYFRYIFNVKCNFGFGSPQSDRCSTCISFSERIKTEEDAEKKQILRVEYAIHKERAKAFSQFLQPPADQSDGSQILHDTLILSFDCQKNLQLLKVPDSAVYYSRNVYLYNLTIVEGYSISKLSPDNAVSYCWTENEFPKNANIISSCLMYHLDHTNLRFYKHIRLVADGCAGQNKNSIVITALLKWLSQSAPKEILDIELVFPITGHSYIPPDQIFAQIEKQVKKKDTILAPQEYLDIISRFSTVRKVGTDVPVYDVKATMNSVLKPCASWPFSISEIKRLYMIKQGSDNIALKGELFYVHNIGTLFTNFCEQNKRLSDLVFKNVEETNKIEKAKKEDIRKLLEKHFGEEWRSLPSLSFFVYLLDVAIMHDEYEHEEDVDDPCECCLVTEQPELII